MSQPRKPPNIWALAGVTYGIVIAVTLLSILTYYLVVPKHAQTADTTRAVTVGSVWIPVYPGATIASTNSSKQEKTTDSTLNFESTDPADRVMSFYETALKKGIFRFETVQKNVQGGGTIRSMVHKGKTAVAVTIQSASSGSRGEIRTLDKDLDDKDTPR
ncbi:MAG TPA: hypothetical protein VGJ09_16070 [Bryobacteraceae bacterium]|jgi:hypothetical protein